MTSNSNVSAINKKAETDTDLYIYEVEQNFDRSLDEAVGRFLSDCKYDIVLLAGPSSSGKTTTAKKIAEKIRQKDRNAFTVSLDDFYFNRDDIPLTTDGLKDFENVTALDLELIHKTFNNLIVNRNAELRVFDFMTGSRSAETNHVTLGKNDVIVVEGIHALNPIITDGLGSDHIFKIYISVSSRIVDGEGKVILSKRNLRLVRRMMRDFSTRNSPPESTFIQWPEVLRGEDKYLFPFESNSDFKINSFHSYEPCIFKNDAIRLINNIEPDSLYFDNARELVGCLEQFVSIDPQRLPENSLLREFLVL